MWGAVQDPTLIILIVAAIISLVFGLTFSDFNDLEWVEGVAILASVVIVVLVASINDYQKEQQFKDLQAKQVTYILWAISVLLCYGSNFNLLINKRNGSRGAVIHLT